MLQKLNPQNEQQNLNRTSAPTVIIGCGFGGMAMAIELKKNGMNDFIILERSSDIGGVWRDNSYPGAACDVVSRFYSFSFDRDREWSQAFAPQGEIWQYALEVVERFGIRQHVRFNAEVLSAVFEEKAGEWTVNLADGHKITTPVLISAVGLFNTANVPEVPGRDTFKGVSFHSSGWNHDYNLEGKTVGVIGNGASGVQFLPKIAPQVAKLNLFQRSPQYVMPKSIFPGGGEWDMWLQKQPGMRWLARLKVFLMFERFIWRRRWKPHLRLQGEAAFKRLLEAKVKDPELRRKLTPNYPMGCKRQLVSDVFYDAMVRPNVDVIDTPIERIVEDGIVTRDGMHRKLDAIIFGTGFKPTAFLTPMQICGLGGRDLNEAWRNGAEAYLGITVTGFPNFFMMYGPNTNAPSSIIFMLECQARYIVSGLKTMARKNARYMNVKADVQRVFNERAQELLSQTVPARADCFTYFKIANGKITTNWPGYATEYKWRTRAVRKRDYEFVSS